MRSELFSTFTNPDVALEAQLSSMLRTPGQHRLLETYSHTVNTEMLPMLYDVWATSKEHPEAEILEVFIHRWNVDVGTDANRTPGVPLLFGTDLFKQDLEELCVAVNTYMTTNELTAEQIEITTRAEAYFRGLGGPNPGAISIARGWHELMLVIRGAKRLDRCKAVECGRLLSIESQSNAVLSGTVYGYHSEGCQEKHTGGPVGEIVQQIPMADLPGAAEAVAAAGVVIPGGETGQPAADAELREQLPEGSENGTADIPGSTTAEQG